MREIRKYELQREKICIINLTITVCSNLDGGCTFQIPTEAEVAEMLAGGKSINNSHCR